MAKRSSRAPGGYQRRKYPYCALCKKDIILREGQTNMEAVQEHVRAHPRRRDSYQSSLK